MNKALFFMDELGTPVAYMDNIREFLKLSGDSPPHCDWCAVHELAQVLLMYAEHNLDHDGPDNITFNIQSGN